MMNNSVHDKTMKNLKKRIKVRLVNNAKDYKKRKQTNFCFIEYI